MFRSEAWIFTIGWLVPARYLTLWFRKGNVGGGMSVEDILLSTFPDINRCYCLIHGDLSLWVEIVEPRQEVRFSRAIKLESLILAQNERWRQA